MCRGDVPLQSCKECVRTATQRISSECGHSKEAIIWHAYCLLHYSNSSFFSTLSESPTKVWESLEIITRQEKYNELVAKTLVEVVAEASFNSSGSQGAKHFATKTASLFRSQSLYTLAQCTPDLSPKDCNSCLHDAMGNISPAGRLGGRVLYPSCNFRFELEPFYYNSPASAPAPTTTGERKKKSRTIIMVLLLVSVPMVVLGFCFYFQRKRRKKSRKDVLLENFGDESATLESLQFNLRIIEAATNKFSQENRIGRGGFGEVYKAWTLWRDENPLEIVDPNLEDIHLPTEIAKCIQIGLCSRKSKC
ncbi:hypothetical protein L6164_007584 [Bauhinia variegata]|uniref:Uncharacterized protein n=1 Tax=Bauhinia variegata TaxID=167791 RepID=A0ACB9PF47_BAUVA|nr:hypothetical protein L6164_007584 [Bauhinia variegata]